MNLPLLLKVTSKKRAHKPIIMSTHQPVSRRTITTHRLSEMKKKQQKIAVLTCYDYTMATLLDAAGVDVILVGDSASNVISGHQSTIPITLDEMIYHAKAVVRGVKHSLVVVDLPFGSYQSDPRQALQSAIRVMKESGAHAVKLEGGKEVAKSISKIISAGIPVMGHLGLIPQSIYKFGTYTVRAKKEEEAERLIKDARLLQELECFGMVLEKIPASLAEQVTQSVDIPTIGIGAGSGVDGQVLVLYDMLGINQNFNPRFLRRYASLDEIIHKSVEQYVDDVKSTSFPSPEEQY